MCDLQTNQLPYFTVTIILSYTIVSYCLHAIDSISYQIEEYIGPIVSERGLLVYMYVKFIEASPIWINIF